MFKNEHLGKPANPCKYKKNPVTIAITGFFVLVEARGVEPLQKMDKNLANTGFINFR
jgi:hypothetical protein